MVRFNTVECIYIYVMATANDSNGETEEELLNRYEGEETTELGADISELV